MNLRKTSSSNYPHERSKYRLEEYDNSAKKIKVTIVGYEVLYQLEKYAVTVINLLWHQAFNN